MFNVLSQKILNNNSDNDIDTVYECQISSNDNVSFTHSNFQGNNQRILSIFVIDFLTLRDYMKIGKGEYENAKYKFSEKNCCYKIWSKTNDDFISIPKSFFDDSYQILKVLWDENA